MKLEESRNNSQYHQKTSLDGEGKLNLQMKLFRSLNYHIQKSKFKIATYHKLHIHFLNTGLSMASKSITVGVGIPMIVVGALMAWLWAPMEIEPAKYS